MTVRRWRGVSRLGFTLVELLVVIIIIGLLMSMLLAAVFKALERGPEIQTRVEIGQMETAVQSVIQTYRVKFLPSRLKLSETNNYPNASQAGTDDYNSVQFLKRMFPRIDLTTVKHDWNRNGSTSDPDVILQGPECLVFFLGGAPGPKAQGFSANPLDPVDTVNSLQPQAFEFKPSRLVPSQAAPGSGYNVYVNNYGKMARPYLYFTSYYQGNDYSTTVYAPATVGGDCGFYGVSPYVDPTSGRFINANGYQIVTAGVQGVFGAGGTTWNPKSGTTDKATSDNQANFAPGLLRAGQ